MDNRKNKASGEQPLEKKGFTLQDTAEINPEEIRGALKLKNEMQDNPHYLMWGVTAFLVIAASVLFCFLIFKFKSITDMVTKLVHILRPIIYGLVLAYLMNPVVNWIELSGLRPLWKKLGKNAAKDKKLHRGISIGLTIILLILLIYLFFSNIIPQLVQSIQTIATQFPTYTKNIEEYIDKLFTRNPQLRTTVNTLLNNYNTELETILNDKIMPYVNQAVAKLSGNILSSLVSVLSTLWNLIIGLIISIYLLASKESFAGQSKKTIYAIFYKDRANRVIQNIRFINHTFGDYIRGKLIDSLIIGLLCFIGMTCLAMPYTLLVSVIVGVTNIIPFFGPYLGAIPSAMLILMVDPKKALIFVIFILILQQFDGNFLGPKILGESTGLSGFWILFSITLLGGYWGVLGMAIGVPVFAIIYAVVRALIEKSLKKKGLSTETEDYTNLSEIRGNDYLQNVTVKKPVRPLGPKKKPIWKKYTNKLDPAHKIKKTEEGNKKK